MARLLEPALHEVFTHAAGQRCHQRRPRLARLNMRAENESIALLRDLYAFDVEAEFLRQADGLRFSGMEYPCKMGQGLLRYVSTEAHIRFFDPQSRKDGSLASGDLPERALFLRRAGCTKPAPSLRALTT